jgi:hypothetical protein
LAARAREEEAAEQNASGSKSFAISVAKRTACLSNLNPAGQSCVENASARAGHNAARRNLQKV